MSFFTTRRLLVIAALGFVVACGPDNRPQPVASAQSGAQPAFAVMPSTATPPAPTQVAMPLTASAISGRWSRSAQFLERNPQIADARVDFQDGVMTIYDAQGAVRNRATRVSGQFNTYTEFSAQTMTRITWRCDTVSEGAAIACNAEALYLNTGNTNRWTSRYSRI